MKHCQLSLCTCLWHGKLISNDVLRWYVEQQTEEDMTAENIANLVEVNIRYVGRKSADGSLLMTYRIGASGLYPRACKPCIY
jgi:hypothetical protein